MPANPIELINSPPDLDLNPGRREFSARQASKHCGLISGLTHWAMEDQLNCTGCPFSREQSTRCMCCPTIGSTKLTHWDVHISVHISQSKSSPFCSGWQPCSIPLQIDKIWIEKFWCFWFNPVTLPLTVHEPSLMLTQFCALEYCAILKSWWNTRYLIASLSSSCKSTY